LAFPFLLLVDEGLFSFTDFTDLVFFSTYFTLSFFLLFAFGVSDFLEDGLFGVLY
jgi:hypothetical protein